MSLTGLEERRIEDESWPELTLAATSLVIFPSINLESFTWAISSAEKNANSVEKNIQVKDYQVAPLDSVLNLAQIVRWLWTCNGGESCCGIAKGGSSFSFWLYLYFCLYSIVYVYMFCNSGFICIYI